MRNLVTFILACIAILPSFAIPADKLSVSTRMLLNERNRISAVSSADGVVGSERLEMLLTLSRSDCDISCLEELGVIVRAKSGSVLSATVPVSAIASLLENPDVLRLNVGEPILLHNDKAREALHVNEVHSGNDPLLMQSYTGKDVIVGVIDCGIDFQHVMFFDGQGNSRVKAAMTVTADSLNNVIYRTYYDPDEISDLVSVSPMMSHGTHTAGSAAGGFMGNAFYGMAPDADLVLCELANPSEPTLCVALDFIFHYADSVGKPAVVNLSLGKTSGAHDGTGDLATFCSNYVHNQPGHVVCVSAGNEGACNMNTSIMFLNEGDSVLQARLLTDNSKTRGAATISGGIDMWSSDTTDFGISVFLYDVGKDSIIWQSDIMYADDLKEEMDIQLSDSICKSLGIDIALFNVFRDYNPLSGRYGVCSVPIIFGKPMPGVALYGRKGQKVSAFAYSSTYELYAPNDKFVKADNYYISNDFACAPNVISVGAYNTRAGYLNLRGDTASFMSSSPGYDISKMVLGEISYFSSFGYDEKGNAYPTITAPGCEIISSFSAPYVDFCQSNVEDYGPFDTDSVMAAMYVSHDNGTSWWSSMAGTSMACPLAAGTIALWLQANPQLTSDQIMEIIRKTADKDAFTQAKPLRFGYGKMNALAGMRYILEHSDVSSPSTTSPARKCIRDGKLVIYSNGRYFDALGCPL